MHEKLVSDAMTRPVRFVRPSDSVFSAAVIMREHHISGLPVLDGDGNLQGILSERDIIRDLHRATGVGSPRGMLELLLGTEVSRGKSTLQAAQERLRKANVGEVMTKRPVTVEADDTLEEAIRLFLQYHVNRLPVLDHTALVGILTRQDVILAMVAEPRRSSELPSRLLPNAHPAPPRPRALALAP